MWCFTHGRTSQPWTDMASTNMCTVELRKLRRDIDWLAEEFVNKTKSKNLNFGQPKFVEWPEKAASACASGDSSKALPGLCCILRGYLGCETCDDLGRRGIAQLQASSAVRASIPSWVKRCVQI